MDQATREWLDKAEVDFGVAAHLYENYFPRPFEIICYHCQQAAEKAIKAIIISQGVKGGLPKLHDLSFLLNQIRNHVQIEERCEQYDIVFTRMYGRRQNDRSKVSTGKRSLYKYKL